MCTKVSIRCPIRGQTAESTLLPFVMISKQVRIDETNELATRILKNISQFFTKLQTQMPHILQIYPINIEGGAIQYAQLEEGASSSSTGSPAPVMKAKFTDLYHVFEANENFATQEEFEAIKPMRIDFLRVDTLTRAENVSTSSANRAASANIPFIQDLDRSLNPELDFTHFIAAATKAKNALINRFALKQYSVLDKIGNKLLMGFSKYMHENKETYEADEVVKSLPTEAYVQALRNKATELFCVIKSKIESSDDFTEKMNDSKIFEIELIITSFQNGETIWVDNRITLELVLLVFAFEMFIKLIPSPKPYSGKSQESVRFALELMKLPQSELSPLASFSNNAQTFEEKKCRLLQFHFDPVIESYYLLYLDIIYLAKQIPSLIPLRPRQAEDVQANPYFLTLSEMVNKLASQLYSTAGNTIIDPKVWFNNISEPLARHLEKAESALDDWLLRHLEAIPAPANPVTSESLAGASSSSSSGSQNPFLSLISTLKAGWKQAYTDLITGAFIREREFNLKELPITRKTHYDAFQKQMKELPTKFLALNGFRPKQDAGITSGNVEEMLTSYAKMHALSYCFGRKLKQIPNRNIQTAILTQLFLSNLEKFNKIATKIGLRVIDMNYIETFLMISKKNGQSSFQNDTLLIYSANEVFESIPGLIIIEQVLREELLANHEEERLYEMVIDLQETCYSNLSNRGSMKADTLFLTSGYTEGFSGNKKVSTVMNNIAHLASDLYEILHQYSHTLRPFPSHDAYITALCTSRSYSLYEKLVNHWNALCPIKLGIISEKEMAEKPPTPIHLSISPITAAHAAHAASPSTTMLQASALSTNNNNNSSALPIPPSNMTSSITDAISTLMPGIPTMSFNNHSMTINWLPIDDDEDEDLYK